MKMVFKAKRPGGGVRSAGGDIYLSGISGGKNSRHALCVRFSEDVLHRLRWRIGDRVYMELDRDGSTDTWTFNRVPEDDVEGLKISANGRDDGPGTVRRTCGEDEMKSVFPNCRRGYQGFLVEGDSKRAVFVVDLADSE
jgi:hypothetical protein